MLEVKSKGIYNPMKTTKFNKLNPTILLSILFTQAIPLESLVITRDSIRTQNMLKTVQK
jgi:hypothetical protein